MTPTAAVALSLALALPGSAALAQQSSAAPAQQNPGQGKQATDSGAQQRAPSQRAARADSAAQMPSSITITAASNLVGRQVRDYGNEQAGEVERLLINAQTGEVAQIIIGSGGVLDLGEQLVAVPWHAIQTVRGDDEIRLKVPREALQKAPRYDEDRLSDLTQPLAVTQITNYYAPLATASGESRQDTSGKSGQSAAGSDAQKQAQAGQGSKRAGDRDQNAASQRGEEQSVPHILVGSDSVTMLAPPLFMSSTDIRGTQVVDQSGQSRGEIDQVMIDADRGQVAYVLVQHGGFLGMGGEWTPVPLAALHWTPRQDAGFVLDADASALKSMPTLPRDDLPTRVSGRDLQQLYQRFAVAPYWRENQTAATEDSGR